jgi:16S rRNA (guanine1516-N2)-methyltransferase
MQQLKLKSPKLIVGNAIDILKGLDFTPDCIYLDPMFPPKRKKSALAKKAMVVLRDIVGNDEDRSELFTNAWQATGRRVVVKCPDYAESVGGKPDECFTGKLIRYDVYLK